MSNKSTSEIIKDIHNEFYTASDRLLEQAKEIINNPSRLHITKGQRLKKLGFEKTKEAKLSESLVENIQITKGAAILANYYIIKYPQYKFITENQVDVICRKYNLVLGDVSIYTGTVPINKVEQIEKFKIDNKDNPYFIQSRLGTAWGWENGRRDPNIIVRGWLSMFTYCPDWVLPFFTVFEWRKIRPIMKICAPVSDMDISNRMMISGTRIKEIPDPVVLQPVKGGYLIVTAWGDESSDELVVNEKMN